MGEGAGKVQAIRRGGALRHISRLLATRLEELNKRPKIPYLYRVAPVMRYFHLSLTTHRLMSTSASLLSRHCSVVSRRMPCISPIQTMHPNANKQVSRPIPALLSLLHPNTIQQLFQAHFNSIYNNSTLDSRHILDRLNSSGKIIIQFNQAGAVKPVFDNPSDPLVHV